MNTNYKPVDRDFLFSLALAKAKGRTWLQISEKAKMAVVDLEIIPWREPKEWAKACKYAEKLVAHEALSENLAVLRSQMNDNVNNARNKSQVANSMVRLIQLQQALRTPKKPKKPKPSPMTEPIPAPLVPIEPTAPLTPTPVQPTEAQAATPAPMPSPLPRESNVGRNTVAAALLLLFGLLAFWSVAHAYADDSPAAIVVHEYHRKTATSEPSVSFFNTVIDSRLGECDEVCWPWDGQPRERSLLSVDSSPPTG